MVRDTLSSKIVVRLKIAKENPTEPNDVLYSKKSATLSAVNIEASTQRNRGQVRDKWNNMARQALDSSKDNCWSTHAPRRLPKNAVKPAGRTFEAGERYSCKRAEQTKLPSSPQQQMKGNTPLALSSTARGHTAAKSPTQSKWGVDLSATSLNTAFKPAIA